MIVGIIALAWLFAHLALGSVDVKRDVLRAAERVYMKRIDFVDLLKHPSKSPLVSAGQSFDNMAALNGIVNRKSAMEASNALINICSVYVMRNDFDFRDSIRENEIDKEYSWLYNEAMGTDYYLYDAPGMAREVTRLAGITDIDLRAFETTGTIINSTHAITAAHNVWPCFGAIRFYNDNHKFYPCTGDEIKDWIRFEYIWDLKYVSVMNQWNPYLCKTSKNLINVSNIVYPNKNEFAKGTLLYYGDFFDKSHLNKNDIALIPIPNPKESIFHIDAMVDIFRQMERCKMCKAWEACQTCFNDYEYLVIVGYPGIANREMGGLLDDFVSHVDLDAFFHVDSQLAVIGIATRFNISNDYILHDIPTLSGFSGSLLYGVNENGDLEPVGVHVGGLGMPYQTQFGIPLAHPFFQEWLSLDTCSKQGA